VAQVDPLVQADHPVVLDPLVQADHPVVLDPLVQADHPVVLDPLVQVVKTEYQQVRFISLTKVSTLMFQDIKY
jgi:hypothetical protein